MKRISVLAVGTLMFVACGPGAKIGGGKQGAAEALFAASGPTKAGSDKSATPVDLTGSVTWKCSQGGSATLSGFQLVNAGSGGSVDVQQRFTLTYNGCGLARSDVGVAVYDGSFAVVQKVLVTTGHVSVEQSFTGRVKVGGAFDDFLEADITQSVEVGGLSGTGSVAMTLKGTLANSSGSFIFDEQVNVTAGHLTADLSKK